MIIVAIIVVVMVPTAALAASGAFTSTTTAPAVSGTNSSTAVGAVGVRGFNTGGGLNTRYGVQGAANGTAGIGVQGTGTKYGVYSNGPLGVAAGKPLSCTGCVGASALQAGSVGTSALHAGSVGASALQNGSVGLAALSAAAKAPQPLNSGETESGTYAIDSPNGGTGGAALLVPITFTRPLAAPIADGNFIYVAPGAAPVAHCPGMGLAAPGFVCVYAQEQFNTAGFSHTNGSKFGASGIFSPTNGASFQNAVGVYTVTAP